MPRTILKAEFLIPEVVGELLRESRARVRILPTRERWFGVTYPEDRPLFRTAILELVDAGRLSPRPLGRTSEADSRKGERP